MPRSQRQGRYPSRNADTLTRKRSRVVMTLVGGIVHTVALLRVLGCCVSCGSVQLALRVLVQFIAPWC